MRPQKTNRWRKHTKKQKKQVFNHVEFFSTNNRCFLIKHHWPTRSVLQRYHCAPSITTNWLTWQLHHKSWRRVFWRVTHYLPIQTDPLSVVKGRLIVAMRNEFLKVKYTLREECLHSHQRVGGWDGSDYKVRNEKEVFNQVFSFNMVVLTSAGELENIS